VHVGFSTGNVLTKNLSLPAAQLGKICE